MWLMQTDNQVINTPQDFQFPEQQSQNYHLRQVFHILQKRQILPFQEEKQKKKASASREQIAARSKDLAFFAEFGETTRNRVIIAWRKS